MGSEIEVFVLVGEFSFELCQKMLGVTGDWNEGKEERRENGTGKLTK